MTDEMRRRRSGARDDQSVVDKALKVALSEKLLQELERERQNIEEEHMLPALPKKPTAASVMEAFSRSVALESPDDPTVAPFFVDYLSTLAAACSLSALCFPFEQKHVHQALLNSKGKSPLDVIGGEIFLRLIARLPELAADAPIAAEVAPLFNSFLVQLCAFLEADDSLFDSRYIRPSASYLKQNQHL